MEVTKSVPAPASCFSPRDSAEELGFAQGLKLEAVNPENQNQICVATVTKIIEHLLWIHLESNDRYVNSDISIFILLKLYVSAYFCTRVV